MFPAVFIFLCIRKIINYDNPNRENNKMAEMKFITINAIENIVRPLSFLDTPKISPINGSRYAIKYKRHPA